MKQKKNNKTFLQIEHIQSFCHKTNLIDIEVAKDTDLSQAEYTTFLYKLFEDVQEILKC